MDTRIREMTAQDWPDVARIYKQGIDTNLATLETKCPEYVTFDASHARECRFVAEQEGKVIGWAALSPISGRDVYRGVAELSVYIDAEHQGQGVGKQLIWHIIPASEQAGYWTLQSGILEDNSASVRLHKACGFRMVGYREKIGMDHKGHWRNTVLMERRSQQ